MAGVHRSPWWWWWQSRDLVPVLLAVTILIGFLAAGAWLAAHATVHVMDSFRHAFRH